MNLSIIEYLLQFEESSGFLWSVFSETNSGQTLITGLTTVLKKAWWSLIFQTESLISWKGVHEQVLPSNDFQIGVNFPSTFLFVHPSQSWHVCKSPFLRPDHPLSCGPVVTSNAPNSYVWIEKISGFLVLEQPHRSTILLVKQLSDIHQLGERNWCLKSKGPDLQLHT